MYLEELIKKINFIDNNITIRLGMKDMFTYIKAEEFKEDFYGKAFYFGEESDDYYDEEDVIELDISRLKVREINLMSLPLMISIEIYEEV